MNVGCIAALSMVLENTAFAGDIVLRLPDIAHSLLRGSAEWSALIQWAVHFCSDTQILTGSDALLLSTVCSSLRNALSLISFNIGYIYFFGVRAAD